MSERTCQQKILDVTRTGMC